MTTLRVMIVDDASAFTRAAAAVVDHADGFELAGVASSGEAAVVMAGELEPDLVLVDVNMPGMGGIAAARQLKLTRPATVVVMVSTYDPGDLPADVRGTGLPYLVKARLDPDTLATAYAAGRDHGAS